MSRMCTCDARLVTGVSLLLREPALMLYGTLVARVTLFWLTAVTGTVTDKAGNSATDPAAVSIDKTKPVIKVDALPAPNNNGWYGDDVTLLWVPGQEAPSSEAAAAHRHALEATSVRLDVLTRSDQLLPSLATPGLPAPMLSKSVVPVSQV